MSSVKETIYEIAKDLHAIGALNKKTLMQILCLLSLSIQQNKSAPLGIK